MFAIFLFTSLVSLTYSFQEFTDPSTQQITSLSSAKSQLTFYQVDFSFQNDKDVLEIISQLNKQQLNINLKFPKEIILPSSLQSCELFSQLQGRDDTISVDCQINQFSNSIQFNIDGSLINFNNNSIVFGQVKNPVSQEQSSDFELCLNNQSNKIICQYRFGKQSFSDQPIQMKSAQVVPLSWNTIGSGASYSFKFQLIGLYLSGHSIRIIFPKYFSSKQAYVRIQDRSCEHINSNLYMGRIIECRIIQSSLSGLIQVDIINMINPKFAGYFMGFQIDLIKYNTNIILETISFDGQIQVQPGYITASLNTIVDKQLISFGIPIFYLTLQTQNELNNGYIEIEFDSQWQITSNICTIIKVDGDDVSNYTCTIVGNTFTVQTFVKLLPLQQIILELPIKQPKIQVGSPKIFRAHPMRQVQKLKAGERGPLEILLFLNVELSPTTNQSIGKIVVSITPKIYQPILLQNGILKCLFYERVMAQKCIFDDTTYSDKTVIIIYTPSNFSYYSSEIPIIITTEGAIPGQQEGIKVNDIIQRYQFTVQTFNSEDSMASPLEIYYGEWIPDSKQLTSAIITPLALEELEMLVIQIDFICPINLIMSSSSTNYALILKFSKGVKIVIPNSQTSIKNHSCYTEGLAGINVRCDLYADRLEIYGFQSLLQGQTVKIIISEIPLSSSPDNELNLTFSIIQITPGMTTRQIELYYFNQKWKLFNQSQPNVSNMDYEVSVLQSSASINSIPSYDIAYTTNPIDNVLYYFSSDFSYVSPILKFTCGLSTCYYLPRSLPNTGFIILEQKQLPIVLIPPNYNQITNLPAGIIQAPPFSGSFQVYLYGLMNSRVVSKAFFFIKFGSDYINTANFFLTNAGEYIIKNTEHHFTIEFIPQNFIPDKGQIKFIFKNGVTVQSNKYLLYCQLKSPAFQSISYDPIQCTKDDIANSVNISGFKKISSGQLLSITLRLKTDALLDPISPTCDIFTLDQFGNPIDSVTGVQNANNPIANNINSLQQFDIIDNYYQKNEYPEIDYVGPFFIEFQQSPSIKTSLSTIEVKFDLGFSLPNGIIADAPLYCQINQKRAYCNVSSYTPQLIVQILPNSNPAIVIDTNPLNFNELLISTEYVSPLDGIKHPSTPNIYQIQLKLTDAFGNSNLSTKYTKINPKKLVFFYVKSFCNTPDQYNLLLFHTKFPQKVTKFSNGGRIYLVFPSYNLAGTLLFDQNLGLQYDEFIDNIVGCNFSQSKNTVIAESGKQLKCRLKPKDYSDDSIRVEIINFDEIQIDQELYLYMAKIKNPVNLVVDITFRIEVSLVDELNGSVISYLNQDQFNVFVNLITSAPNPDLANPYVGNIFKMPASVGDLNIPMISNRAYYSTSFANEDIYLVELPDSILPSYNFDGCDATQFQLCLSFPEINTIVYITNVIPALTFSQINDIIVKKLPIAVPQQNNQYYSYVWQNKQYKGRVVNQITTTQWLQLIGTVTNAKLNLMNNQSPLINSIKVQISIEFIVTHYIPPSGSIVIQFPNDFPAIYSHCQSSVQIGSMLFSQYLTNSGSLGCTVQNNLQWIISNINEVQPNSKIIIQGRVDLPINQVTTQSLQITTLSTGYTPTTLTTGYVIDQALNAPNTQIIMSQYSTMKLVENNMIDQQQEILRSGFRGPLRIHIQINDNVVGNSGTFQIDLFRYSVNKKNTNGFPYNASDKYVCGFESKVQQGKKIGCLILNIQEVNTSNDQNSLRLVLLPNEQLNQNERYELVLTSLNGISQEGIQFGLTAGIFRISVSCDPQGLGSYKTIDQIYMEIYSNDFQSILFQSLINISGEWNLILMKMQPSITIKTTDQIILEFPVISLDAKDLFDEDGGYNSLKDSDLVLYDLVDASAPLIAGQFQMQCKFFKGYKLLQQNLKFICSQLSQSITNTDFIQIAISIKNPTILVNNQLSIPIQIYTYDVIQEIKTHYRHEINAIPILNPGMTDVTGLNGDFNLGNSQETVCHRLVQTFHFRAQQTQSLKSQNSDVYLLRLNFPLFLNQYISLVDCKYNILAPSPFSSKCAILVNNKYILVFPTSAQSINQNDLVWIDNKFFTPHSKLENAALRVVTGFAYYSSRRITEKIIYYDMFPQLLTQKSGDVSMVIQSRGNIQPYQKINMDYIFTITAPYWGIVKKVAIVFPISYGFQFKYSNCKEDTSSEVEVAKCEIDPTTQIIWITVVQSASLPYFQSDGVKKLSIETLSLSMVNPTISTATLDIPYNQFDLQFYSWYETPVVALNPRISDIYICFSDDKQIPGVLTINSDKAGVYPDMPAIFDYIHQQYFDEFVSYDRTQRMPIRVEIESPVNIAATTWALPHKIIVHYGSGIQIPKASAVNDLLVDSLVCYVNNQRVRCTDDTPNQQIIVEFIEAQPVASNIFILISSVDPNDLEKDGFFYVSTDGAYSIRYEIQINGGNNYFLHSDFFSAFYSTANQSITPPHRGIEVGSLSAANNFKGAINVLEFTLSFDRSDIRGLVFEFLTVDQLKNQIYTTTTMHNLQSGSPFPCSKGIPVPDSSPDCDITLNSPQTSGCQFPIKCFIEEGEITQFGKPIRIHVFGFAYTPKKSEVFRLMIENPIGPAALLATPIDLLVVVKAYGGSQTYQYVYGNEFKGDYQFLGDISLVQNTANVLPISPLVPSSALWQINSLKFTTNQNIDATKHSSLTRIVLGDQSDNGICFFAPDQYVKDIFYLEVKPTPTTWVRYAYAYRLFQSSESTTKIFNLSKVRCKHFRYNVQVNHFMPSANDVLTYQLQDSQSITNGQLAAASVKVQYYDFLTIQRNQPSQTLVKINIAQLLNYFTSFYGNIISLEFKGTNQANTIFQNGATSCTVMSGLSIQNQSDHIGEQVKCEIETNTISGGIATRLKISNFDTIVNLPFQNSLGTLLPQKDVGLKVRIMHTNSQYDPANPIDLIFAYYANEAAYQPNTQQGHLMFYKILSHTPDYNFPKLTAAGTNQGFITQSLNVGTTYKISKITNNQVGAQENIQMTIDFQTNLDMYIGGDCNNTPLCLTCNCAQDCIPPTYSTNRQYWSHWYVFLFGLELNTAEAGCSIDVLGRDKYPNSPFDPEEVINCSIIYSANGYPVIYIQFFEQFDEMGKILNYKNKPWQIYITLLKQTFSPTHTQSYVWSRFHIYQERCFNTALTPSTVLLMENVFEYTNDYLQIGNTPTFSSLSLEELYTTEYAISLNNINLDIGLAYNTVLQLVFPTYTTSFVYGTDPTKESQQISCLCSIPAGSPLTAQQCYRRNPLGLFQASVLLYINAPKGVSINCYIPEIVNPVQQINLGVLFKITSPSIYSDYKGKGGFSSVYQQEVLVNILAQGALKAGTFDTDPLTFYDSKIVNEKPLVRFAVDVMSPFFNKPYVYLRLPSIGPIPTIDFCDSPIFIQNRIYTVQTLLIICQVDQNPTQITIFKGSPQQMAPAKPYTLTPYTLDILVFDGATKMMTHKFQQLIPIANFKLAMTPLFKVSNIFMTLDVGLQTQICAATFLLNSFIIPKYKGRILIQFLKTQVTLSKNSCFVIVELETIGDLQCRYDGTDANNHRFWIYRTAADLNTVNTINVYFGVKNHGSSNIDFNLLFYYSYDSDTQNMLSVWNIYTQNIQTTDSASTKIFLSYSYMKLYPFVPKLYRLPNTSERFIVKFQTLIPGIQHLRVFLGKVVDTNLVSVTCTLREYDTVKIMSYHSYACSTSIFDPTGQPAFEIYFEKVQLKLQANVNYEFIISTLKNNSIIGFQKDNVNFSKEVWMFAREKFQNLLYYTRLLHYYDQGISQIKVNSLYFTSALQTQLMSLYMEFTIAPALPAGFPTSFITLTFPELTLLQSFPTFNAGDTINCELSTTFQQIVTRIQNPRCVIVPNESGQLQIRIEQYGVTNSNTKFSVSIDDILIPPKYVQQWWNINLKIAVFQNASKIFYLRVQQLLVVDGVTTTPIVNAIGPFNFNPATVQTRGQLSDYPVSIPNYPFNSNNYDQNNYSGYKIRLQFYSGIIAANSIFNILIEQSSGTVAILKILWINSKSNSIYMSAPLITQTQQLDLVFKDILNPHAYQQPAYGVNPYIQLSFYQGNNFQRQTPLLSHLLSNSAQLNLIPNIDYSTFVQQIPALIEVTTPFIFDNSIIAATNQRGVGEIQFKINGNTPALVQRKIKRIVIKLTGGFTNLESCWITAKISFKYLTNFQSCHIISADTLSVLDVDKFDSTQQFSIFILGHVISNNIQYSFELQTSDYLADATSSMIANLGQFDGLSKIYSELDFIQEKYIFQYYEIAYTQLYAQDITSSLTFNIQFDNLLTLTYNINYMEISTSTIIQPNQSNAIMCSYSPVLPTNHLGLTIFCSCAYNPVTKSYQIQSPVGGLSLNQQYALKISEVVQNSQIQMQSIVDNGHEQLVFNIKDVATDSVIKYQVLPLFLLTRWNNIAIKHSTTTSTFYDVIQLSFSLTKDVVQNTNEEVQLVIQIEGNYYLQDLGITQVYIDDQLGSFTSGQRFHCLFTPNLVAASNTPDCILQIGQYSNKYDQIRIIVSNIGNLLLGTTYSLKVGVAMNPVGLLNTLDYTFLIVKQRKSTFISEQISQIIYKKRFLNHNFVKDPSIPKLLTNSDFILYDNIYNYIQRNDLGMAISILNTDLNDKNQIVLKYDNTLKGILNLQSVLSSLIIANCEVSYFKTINLVLLNPLSSIIKPSLFNLGDTYQSQNYYEQWGFSYVYITETLLSSTLFYNKNLKRNQLNIIPDLTLKTFTRVSGMPNTFSQNQYQIDFLTPYIPKESIITIKLPIELNFYKSQLNSIKLTKNFKVNNNHSVIRTIYLDTTNIIQIHSFGDIPANTNVSIQLLLDNLSAGSPINLPSIEILGNLKISTSTIVKSSTVVGVTVSTTPKITPSLSILKIRPTYLIIFYTQEFNPLLIQIATTATTLVNSNNYVEIVFDQTKALWQFASGSDIVNFINYYIKFYYISNRYYQSSLQIFQGYNNIATNILTLQTYPTYDATQNLQYYILFNSERAQPNYQEGMKYPKRGVIQNVVINIRNKGTNNLVESSYAEYEPQVRKDGTFVLSVINSYASQNSRDYIALSGDEIRIEFEMNDEISQIFIPYLGFSQVRQQIQCQENSTPKVLSPSPIQCYLEQNQIRIPILQNIPSNTLISFWISNIQNPVIQTAIGVYLKIMTNCRGNLATLEQNDHRCILYHSKNYYTTKPLPTNDQFLPQNFKIIGIQYKLQAAAMSPSTNTVYVKSSHSYQILFDKAVPANKDILITYPDNHIHNQPCSSSQGQCQILNTRSLIFKPSSPITAGQLVNFSLDNVQNGISLSSHSQDNFIYIEIYDSSTSLIDQAFKIQFIPYTPYQTGISALIYNTQTQNTYLKGSFKNIAQLTVNNIWLDQYINHFVIWKPTIIQGFIEQSYCNATLLTSNPNPYPITLLCTISTSGDALFIQADGIVFDSTFPTLALSVYFKLIVDDKFPPQGVPAGFTDEMKIYGCVQSCDTPQPERYYQTLATTRLYVSDAKVPYYSDIYWNQYAFNQAKSIFQGESRFYGVLQQSSPNQNINKIILNIEDSFQYPAILFIQGCQIYNNQIDIPLDKCQLKQNQGNSQIEITLSTGYFLSLQPNFIYIQTLEQEFDAPEYPGQHYQIRVNLFENNSSDSSEEIQVFFSRVIGIFFDRSKMQFLNGLDSKTTNLNEIIFVTSSVTIPQGYAKTTSSDTHSEIHVLFEWIPNGVSSGSGYSNDIGSGAQDGQEIACLSKKGLTFRENEGIKCILKRAKSNDETSRIRVLNYEMIDANTQVHLMFIGIESLDMNSYGLIKIAVELVFDNLEPIVSIISSGLKSNTYDEEINRSYLYMPSPLMPDKTTLVSINQNTNPTTVTKVGSITTLGSSDFEFTFTLGNKNLKVTDYITFIFPDDFSSVQSPQGSNLYVFSLRSTIFIQPLVQLNMNTVVTFRINNLMNPYFTIPDSTLQINAYTFIDRKQDTSYTFSLNNYKNDYNILISNTNLQSNSTLARAQNVRYSISFQLNQFLPSNGIISIFFPTITFKSLYKLKYFSCYLDGFQDESYCEIGGYNKANVFLKDLQLDSNSIYNIVLLNVTNPSIDLSVVSQLQYFSLAIYYSAQFLSINQPISLVTIGYPQINQISPRPIDFKVQVDYPIYEIKSIYTFGILCDFDISEDTRIVILLGSDYNYYDDSQANLNEVSCSSPFIIQDTCILKYSLYELSYTLEVKTSFIPSMNYFNLIATIMNPSYDTSAIFYRLKLYEEDELVYYYASSTINSNQRLQQTIQFYSIQDNSNSFEKQVFIDSFTLTQNIPNQSNQQAYYIFKICQNNINLQNLFGKNQKQITITLKFPENFVNMNGYEESIEYFIDYYQQDNKVYTISILEQLISSLSIVRVSSLDSSSNQLYSSNTISFTLRIQSQDDMNTLNSWNYLIIKNVVNPQLYQPEDFELKIFDVISDYQLMYLGFQKKLKYEIMDNNPYSILISKIQIQSLLFNAKTDYVFTIEYSDDFSQVIHIGQKYLVILTLPRDSKIKSLQTLSCFIQGNLNQIKSDSQKCSIYPSADKSSSSIVLEVTFTSIMTSSFEFVVRDLVNPSSNYPSIQSKEFSIRIVEDNSSQIICSDTNNRLVNSQQLSHIIYYEAAHSLGIQIGGPAVLYPGFQYEYKISISRPSMNLSITPIVLDYQTSTVISSQQIQIKPNTIKFTDFENNLTKSFSLSFAYEYPVTITSHENNSQFFTIRFQQTQDAQLDNFFNIPDLDIQLSNDNSIQPTIQLNYNNLDINTQGYPFFLKVLLSSLPASTTYLSLVFDTNDSSYSDDSASYFNIKNPKIRINNNNYYEFELSYVGNKIPYPIPLQIQTISQTEEMQNIYKFVPSNKFYLVFTKSPVYRNGIARIQMMQFIPDFSYKLFVGQSMNFKSSPEYSPQIMKVDQQKQSSNSQTSASFVVFINQPSKLKYILTLGQEKQEPNTQNFLSGVYEKAIMIGQASTTQYSNSVVENVQEILIENLSAQQYYTLYFMAQNAMGYSSIVKQTFNTTDISQPCSLFLSFTGDINDQTLILSLSRIVRISPQKIIILSSSNYRNSNPSYGYQYTRQVMVIPDEKGSYDPTNLLQSYKDDIVSQLQLFIPQFDTIGKNQVQEAPVQIPQFLLDPYISNQNIYDITIIVKTQIQSTLYAVILKENQNFIHPQQISSCIDGQNQEIDSIHCFKILTDTKGQGEILFDFLNEETTYYIYITAAAFTPYESPLHLSKFVKTLSFSTYKNPNINQCGLYSKMKDQNEKLASILQKFADDDFVYC